MQLAEIPDNDPLLNEIKEKLQMQDYGGLLYSIRNGYHDMMLKILEDNFNKKQAKFYNEKLIFWIRKKVLGTKIKDTVSKTYWSKSQIILFLYQKNVPDPENLLITLKTFTTDIRKVVLREKLSKIEFQTVFPHINEYFNQGEQENPYAKNWTEYQLQTFNFIQKRLANSKAQLVINYLKQQKIEKVSSLLKQELSKDDFQFIEKKIKVNFDPNFGSELKSQNPQILSFSKYGQKLIDQLFVKEKSKQKNSIQNLIFDELQQKFGQQDKKSFQQVKDLLQKGKRKNANLIVKDILSKRDAQYFTTKINQVFQQKLNKPIPSSTFQKNNPTGIQLYHLQTQSKLDVSESQMINVMIVGMTGVGKTTFLNSLVNYLMNVQMEDNFRYIISKDSFQVTNGKSSTKNVNIYSIPKQGRMKKAMRLIDIPGLADTAGIMRDKENLLGIFQKIKDEVPFLNLILYVFKASQTRVTKEAQYVMGQIMGMFGKDMGSNIRFILTFADNSAPCVLEHLQDSFPEIINQIKLKTKDWYLIVNNSALFQKINQQQGQDVSVKVSFYNMGQLCLQKTLEVMQNIPAVSTKQSQDVMKLRKQLQQEIKQFQQYINASLKNQQQIRKLIANIGNQREAMEKINYKYEVEEERIQTQKTTNFVTSCLTCKFTCHSDCAYENNSEKINCCKMASEHCTACPLNCHWTAHINDHLIVRRVFVKVSKTYDELQKKYRTLESSKTKNQSLVVNLFDDYIESITKVKLLCDILQKKTLKLADIELRKVNHLTIVEYIDILIASQENQKNEDYLKRIEQYESIKNHHKRLDELLDENDEKRFTCFADLMRIRVKQLIQDTKMANQLIQRVNLKMNQLQTFQKDLIQAKEAQKIQMRESSPTGEQDTTSSQIRSNNNG